MEITRKKFMKVGKDVASKIVNEELHSEKPDAIIAMMLMTTSALVVSEMADELFGKDEEE